MAYTNRFGQSEEYRREELIRKIEHSVENLTLQCIGGGYYHFDYTSNRIVLDRSSYDFGKPKWHLLEVLKVPSVYRGMRLVSLYDDNYHEDFNVSDELRIEYYD